MVKQALSETSPEFAAIKEEWFNTAKSIKNPEEFTDFYNHLMNDYRHDYGTIVHAIGAITVAAAQMAAIEQGITGFQAGLVMWDFIRHWNHQYNKCGLRLIDYDNMLYPQYAYRFDKTISKEVMDSLQKEAKKRIQEDGDTCHEAVYAHWLRLSLGIPPFGYRVTED